MNINLNGAYRFIDSEDENKDIRLTLNRRTISEYDDALKEYIKLLQVNAGKAGASYMLCNTGEKTETIMYEKMNHIFSF